MKKSRKYFFIICVSFIITLSIVGILFLNNNKERNEYCELERIERYEDDITEEDNISVIDNLRLNATRHFFLDTTGKIIKDSVEWIYNDSGKSILMPYSSNGKRGYVNTRTCRIQIEPRYEHAWVFREGLGAVIMDDQLYYIDERNNIVIQGFDYVPNKDFFFKNGVAMAGRDSLVGLIDKTGKWILPPKYDYIRHHQPSGNIHAILPNHRIEEYSYNGKLINECFCRDAYIHISNTNVIVYESDLGWFGLIDINGKRITEPLYKDFQFYENFILYQTECGKWGIMDLKGRILIKDISSNIHVLD